MPIKNNLEATVAAFTQWRNTRTLSNKKTPESLRQQAVALLPHYSISRITRALKLSHSQLKGWSSVTSPAAKNLSFITLPSVEENSLTEQLNLEVRLNNGTQLRLSGEISSSLLCFLVQTLAVQGGAQP